MKIHKLSNSGSTKISRFLATGFALVLAVGLSAQSGFAQSTNAAQSRLIIRDNLGLNGLLPICALLRCSQTQALGDPQGQLFMIQVPSQLAPLTSLLNL